MQEFVLKLTTADLDLIGNALLKMPARLCNALLEKINRQLEEQQREDEGAPAQEQRNQSQIAAERRQ